jgi:hypothetical protein
MSATATLTPDHNPHAPGALFIGGDTENGGGICRPIYLFALPDESGGRLVRRYRDSRWHRAAKPYGGPHLCRFAGDGGSVIVRANI